MLAQRLRRWTNIKPEFVQRRVFSDFHVPPVTNHNGNHGNGDLITHIDYDTFYKIRSYFTPI